MVPPQPRSSLAVPKQGHRSLPRPTSCHLLAALGRRDSQLPTPHPPLLNSSASQKGWDTIHLQQKRGFQPFAPPPVRWQEKPFWASGTCPLSPRSALLRSGTGAPRDKEQAPGLISARQSRHLAVWGRCAEYRHLTLVQDLLRIPSQASHCKWESAHFPELETDLPEDVKGLLGIVCLPVWKPSKMIIVQTVTGTKSLCLT